MTVDRIVVSAHPELVEGWAGAIPAHPAFPAAIAILQQVQDERRGLQVQDERKRRPQTLLRKMVLPTPDFPGSIKLAGADSGDRVVQ